MKSEKIENVSINNLTKWKLPSFHFDLIKNDILGKSYLLSIAFVSRKKSQELNRIYRKKDKPTNILSFNVVDNVGELVICPSVVKKEASGFDRDFKNFLGFLVIHGMLHLKGMEHGSIMDKAEKKYDTKYFSRVRHRHQNDASSGRRNKQRRRIS